MINVGDDGHVADVRRLVHHAAHFFNGKVDLLLLCEGTRGV